MKLLAPLLLLAAGLVLGWIALRAPEPTYVPPRARELPEVVPAALSGEVPEGCVVRTLDVEGICCDGCGARLYAALAGVDEVREAAVDPGRRCAQAVVPADLDVARLEAALTFDEYRAHRSAD